MSKQNVNVISNNGENLHPGFSVDCVIIGFHDNILKVLLLKPKYCDEWSLPGGFVDKNEDVDEAAIQVLKGRTGLENIFLKQFHLFGSKKRNNKKLNIKALTFLEEDYDDASFLLQRFLSLGYYALVDFSNTMPQVDYLSEACEWKDVSDLPPMILDHKEMINKAMEVLRSKLNNEPIGYNLLNEKFTIPELQALYETILGKKLDRRNFLRRILSYDILVKLDEKKTGGAHKAPNLYSFDKEKYHRALINGLNSGW
ncbi:MAG: hypothetical protein JWN56_1866 [Sphingobacteriales bacterium]|nr:hypothetical protein [Sphingobacteriales bacterium]